MKKCSYCGAEYTDDAIVCPIDQTPFEDASFETSSETSSGFLKFGIFSENKIPVSLAIVSYFFFFPGAICFAFTAFALFMLIFSGGFAGDGVIVLESLLGGVVGVFFLYLSRGLRKCSRGWRTCALILIWWGFIGMSFNVGRYFFDQKTFHHETIAEFLLENALGFILQVWQYRVLTRPDIRELFGLF